MQFYTTELQNIINELSQTGISGGYFATLCLIFKLIGLFIGPLLILAGAVIIYILFPKFVIKRLITKEGLKQMTVMYIGRSCFGLDINENSKSSKMIRFIYYLIIVLLSLLYIILISPFFFVTGSCKTLFNILSFTLITLVIAGMVTEIISYDINVFKFSTLYKALSNDVNTFEKTLIRNEQGMFPDRKEVLEKAKEVFSDRIGKITYY